MRPGIRVAAGSGSSLNSSSSMPSRQPKAYSLSVRPPIETTRSASHRPTRCERGEGGRADSSSSAAPANAKPSAVFGFMETWPGSTLFRTGRSRHQPVRTATPTSAAAAPQSVVTRGAAMLIPRERFPRRLALRPAQLLDSLALLQAEQRHGERFLLRRSPSRRESAGRSRRVSRAVGGNFPSSAPRPRTKRIIGRSRGNARARKRRCCLASDQSIDQMAHTARRGLPDGANPLATRRRKVFRDGQVGRA